MKLILAVLFCALIGYAAAWGSDGHKAIAQVAQSRLTQKAADTVTKILKGQKMSDVAAWADYYAYHGGSWSKSLHYINTPDNACNFDYQRDCRDRYGTLDRCSAGAIKNYTQILENEQGRTGINSLHEMSFLIHFVGDIHQPLHVGFTSDYGGNNIHVYWYGKQAKLHHIWDDELLWKKEDDNWGYGSWPSYATYLTDKLNNGDFNSKINEWLDCGEESMPCVNKWASESVTDACQYAYKDAPQGAHLGDDYYKSRTPIVDIQLARAGIRLAALLNDIYK